jgi:hypothetical protein
LLERALNGFVFAGIQDLNEVFDRFLRRVKLCAAFCKDVALFSEVGVLLEGLLVDVGVLFKGFLDAVEAFVGLRLPVISICLQSKTPGKRSGLQWRSKLTLFESIFLYFSKASSGRIPKSRILRATSAALSVKFVFLAMLVSIRL